MTVQYRYTDFRLAYKSFYPNRKILYGENAIQDRIWVPHLIISNGKDSNRLGVEKNDVYVTISPDGAVVFTQRISTIFYCWMSLIKFPFDVQSCQITWRSWTSNMSHLVLNWDVDQPVAISERIHLQEFVLYRNLTSKRIVEGMFAHGALSGNFSELIFEFHLRREIGYYLMCYFLPSILLVSTSWVTFWLQADAGPPRAILGTSTVVAFVTLNVGLVRDLPKSSSIKASDVWFLAISIFIFGSLIEFAFVNVIWRRKKQVELVKADSRSILAGALAPSLARERFRKVSSSASLNKSTSFANLADQLQPPSYIELRSESQDGVAEAPPDWKTMTPQEVAIWVDRKARIIFPVLFLIFNALYWTFVYVL